MDTSTLSGTLSPPSVAAWVESGPAIDASVTLGVGRHVIGRSGGAAVRVDDPLVEPHHAVLEIADDGRATVVQVAGRVPLLVDGVPVSGPVALDHDSCLELGATRIRVDAPPAVAPPPHTGEVPGDPARLMVVRSPRAVPFMAVASVEPPECDDATASGGGVHAGVLMGAVGGVMTGLAMAMVTGSPLMMVFGFVAGAVSFAAWAIGRIRAGRERLRHRRRHDDEVRAFVAAVEHAASRIRSHHTAAIAPVSRRLDMVDTHELWSRRADHGDAFEVTIGRGDVERPVPVGGCEASMLPPDLASVVERHRTLHDVAVPVSLDARDRYVLAVEHDAVHDAGAGSDDAWAVVRSLVLQLAATTGPADWCVRAVVRDPGCHGWLDRLPHAATADGRPAVVAAADAAAVADAVLGLDDGDERRVVVVCDAPALLATRTGPLRRLLDADRPVTVILVVDDGSSLPAVCSSVVHLGARGVARWVPDLHDAAAMSAWGSTRLHVSGVSRRVAERLAGRLERHVDPEDPSSASGRLPATLRLGDLPGVPETVDGIVESWSSAGSDPAPAAVIGMSVDGMIEIDLVRDGPHGLVAGTTGSGKSELLRTLVASLALRVPPSQLAFVLVDYKGGSTFDALARLPHTVGVVTDLDEGLAARALVSLDAELHRRERILRSHGAIDLAAYRSVPDAVPLARLVVVIDEFAALAKELPDFLSALVGIAQRGRSLGIHLVLATQRPAGVIDDAIRANTNLRLALRLHDVADAIDVVGDRSPASFARGLPGRGLLRLGPDEVVEFQAAAAPDLAALADRVVEAAARLGVEPPHRPWLPPLGDDLDGFPDTTSEPGAIGVVDDPAGQRRFPLRWDVGGNLALVGALGTGSTTTLLALAATIGGDDSTELHVIDARGDVVLDVIDGFARCAGVVRVHERERVDRMLRRLVADVDRRRASTGTGDESRLSSTVLLVDGLTTLRRSLDEPVRAASLAALDRVLAEGPAVGVVTAAVVEPEGGSLGSLLGRFGERWVFRLDDAGVAPLIGVPARRLPPAVPGRLVVAGSGLEAQVQQPDIETLDHLAAGTHLVERVVVLPEVVRAEVLEPVASGGAAVGLRFDDLSVARLDLPGGDRVLVAGPARSGRSTLLAHLVEQWRALHADGTVVELRGADRGVDMIDLPDLVADALARHAPMLVAVDDAERVDDDRSTLVRLAAQRPGGPISLYVAGRADALRSTFDHWTSAARKQRTGFVMAATADLDADVLGTPVPRRCPIVPRPGLAWMIAHGECTLVQTVSPTRA